MRYERRNIVAIYSDIIAELRRDKGIQQRDIAKHFGIAQSTYSMYETGVRRMSIEMLVEIAYYLDASVDYILGISTAPKPVGRKATNPYRENFF